MRRAISSLDSCAELRYTKGLPACCANCSARALMPADSFCTNVRKSLYNTRWLDRKITNRPQAPTKQDAIKTCYAPRDAVSVPCQKTLHDCPPYEVRQKHHAGNGHGASLYFGCGQRPRCGLCVSVANGSSEVSDGGKQDCGNW